MTKFRIGVPADELLAEIESLQRSAPSAEDFARDDDAVLSWRGRAVAVISAWSLVKGNILREHLSRIDQPFEANDRPQAIREVQLLLHEARHAKMLEVGPQASDAAIGAGAVFEYFTELKRRLQLAQQDILFVDPYLDADFAERYLPQIGAAVGVRLLTSGKRISKLLPAIAMFAKQTGVEVQVREATFHDRFVFIDGRLGFQSGSSFKDGAAKAPTELIELVDTLAVTLE